VLRSLIVLLLVGASWLVTPSVAAMEPGGEQPPEAESACQFCGVEQSATAFLCHHCGRLFRIDSLEPENRFWGDAFYIYSLPTISSRPQLVAEMGPDGLLRETASFDLGDRYEYSVTEEGATVSARIRGPSAKEAAYVAEIVDSHDESGRLTSRAVHGVLKTKPKRYLYRRIDYRFAGERIEAAEVGSWVYVKASDWKNRAAQWIHHNLVEVRLEYSDDLLVRIHSERRKGVRDLRGNPDYAQAERFTESVEVESGLVVGFGPPEIQP